MESEAFTDRSENRSTNSAVARCRKAYTEAFAAAVHAIGERRRALEAERTQEEMDEDEEYDFDNERETFGLPSAISAARKAYRLAAPALSGEENIRDFIACIADGSLLGVFLPKEHTNLLYAAQVAISAERGCARRYERPGRSLTF